MNSTDAGTAQRSVRPEGGALIKHSCSFKEAVNQSLSVVGVTSTDVHLEATGLAGNDGRFGSAFSENAGDTVIIVNGQSLTDLLGDLAPGRPLAQNFIEVVDELGAVEQLVHHDGLLVRLQTSVGSDSRARGVVPSTELASQQELLGLTTTEGVVTHEALEDAGVVESVEHFAAKQLKAGCVASFVILGG